MAPPRPPTAPACMRWRAADAAFGDWALDGTRLAADGRLALDPAAARRERDPYPPGGYYGRSFYTGGEFLVGEAISPVAPAAPFREAIASWEADTPPGTWLEARLRLRLGERWTDYYSLGVWAADGATVARHSVTPQGDADARVAVDTLVLREDAPAADALQLQLRLFAVGPDVSPSVRGATVATSGPPGRPAALTPGDPRHWDRVVALPACSQMVYPDGGARLVQPDLGRDGARLLGRRGRRLRGPGAGDGGRRLRLALSRARQLAVQHRPRRDARAGGVRGAPARPGGGRAVDGGRRAAGR